MIYISYIEKQHNVVEISNISTIDSSDLFITLLDLVEHTNIQRLDFSLTILNDPAAPIITESNEPTDIGYELFNLLWEHSAIPFPKGYKNIKRERTPRVSFHFQKSKLDIKDFRDRLVNALAIISEFDSSKIVNRIISSINLSVVEFICALQHERYWTNTVEFIGVSENTVTIGAENRRTGFVERINIQPNVFISTIKRIIERQHKIGLLDNVEYNHVVHLSENFFNNCSDSK